MQEPVHNPARVMPAVVPVSSPLRVATPPPLPIPSGPRVGWDTEVAVALALLARPDVRLLTLTGPGGVGKSRLALHIARAIDLDSLAAIWSVPMASVRDPDQVVPTIASCIGIREARQLLPPAEITGLLGESAVLLVLDNMEQVIESAIEIANLLAGLPNSKFLVTSREPLHISGEHVLSVPCLNSPDALRRLTAAEIADLSAVKLFLSTEPQRELPDFTWMTRQPRRSPRSASLLMAYRSQSNLRRPGCKSFYPTKSCACLGGGRHR